MLEHGAPRVDLERLRPLLETALDAVVVMDRDGWVVDWNRRAEATFGWTREEAIGRLMADLIVPPDLRQAHREGLRRHVESGEERILGQRLELTGMTREGREIPVELSISRWDAEDQSVFVGFLRDLSAVREAAEALRQSQARLFATQQHASVGIAEVDAEGRYQRVNPAISALTGYTEEELLGGMGFADVTHPEDRDGEMARYRRQVAGEVDTYAAVNRYLRKDLRVIWVNVSASAVRDADGRFLYGIRVVQDVTERRLAEARQRLLMAELNHRVKNILAMVMSIAAQTGRTAGNIEDFNRGFADRLKAMSKSHELLIRERWEGAGLHDVIVAVLSHQMDRLRLEGRPVRLNPRAALSLSLILHELGTNAAKYGAWSEPGGMVDLAWRLEGPDDRLFLRWIESGGPRPDAGDPGFGSRLIHRLARDDFEGEARFAWDPEGVRVELELPVYAPDGAMPLDLQD